MAYNLSQVDHVKSNFLEPSIFFRQLRFDSVSAQAMYSFQSSFQIKSRSNADAGRRAVACELESEFMVATN